MMMLMLTTLKATAMDDDTCRNDNGAFDGGKRHNQPRHAK